MRWAFGTLLGVAFVAALVIVALNLFVAAAPNRVYTVAEVQAGLRRHPQAWAGRTVQMTGDVIMQVMGNCPTSVPACTPPTWVFLGRLGPEGKPAPSVALAQRMAPAQRMALVMINNRINQQRAFAFEQRSPTAATGTGDGAGAPTQCPRRLICRASDAPPLARPVVRSAACRGALVAPVPLEYAPHHQSAVDLACRVSHAGHGYLSRWDCIGVLMLPVGGFSSEE